MRKLLLDLPSDRPALDFDSTATALAGIVERSAPQFAVGIFGGWGSGKTTLMHAIERNLTDGRSFAVRFSAWRYEKEEHLIVPLLDTIREALLAAQDREPAAKATASTIGRVIRSIVAGASLKVGLPGALELSFKANEALARHDQEGAGAPPVDEADLPGSIYHASFRALQSAFSDLVGDARHPRVRIVVFIDDLDRCFPENALQVLESMKLFFDLPGFVFVVGLDQEVVQQVIDSKYASSPGGVRVSGSEYIQKVFQLPYRIAPVALEDLQEFLEAAYAEADLDPGQRDELRRRVEPHLRWLVGDAAVNPREIKRYINAYTLLVEVSPHLVADAILALQTLAFRAEWYAANTAILAYDELFVDALRRQCDGEATALADLDPELANLPDDLLQYVAPGGPGNPLLHVGSLRPYLTSGEAVRSTQDGRLMETVRIAGGLRHQVALAVNGQRPPHEVAQDVFQGLSLLELPLTGRAGGALGGAFERDIEQLRRVLDPYRSAGTAPLDGDAATALFANQVSPTVNALFQRVLRLYRQGDIAGDGPA